MTITIEGDVNGKPIGAKFLNRKHEWVDMTVWEVLELLIQDYEARQTQEE